MKECVVQSENVRDLSTGDGESGLQNLIACIDNEITAALRFQQDDTVFAEEIGERENIGRHICFELAGKRLAIPLTAILEAGELQVVQSLPLLPDWLTGITNIRGEIISVVNLGLFMGSKKTSRSEAQPYLVVYDDKIKIIITVDRILGTRSLYRSHPEKSKGTPDATQMGEYFAGLAIYQEKDTEKEIGLFDLYALLSSNRLRNFGTV